MKIRTPETGYGMPEKEIPEKIAQKLLERLPELAKTVIEDRPENENFLRNPNDYLEHEPNWHQFGIIAHTEKFAEFYQTEAQQYLKKWGVADQIDEKLSEKIGDRTKAELLEISIPLHDIGKFARGFKEKEGEKEPDYKGHEAKSEKIILGGSVRERLETLGFTKEQIKYIGRCAGLHYELGKVRDEAKKSDLGYTIAFTESEQFKKFCDKIAGEFPEYKEEVGLLFLGDSLAKTDIIIDADTDQEIEGKAKKSEQKIQERGLNSKLINAVKQRPVNIAIARKYLENIYQ